MAEWQIELGWWWQWSPSPPPRTSDGGRGRGCTRAWRGTLAGWPAILAAWRCPCPVVSSGLGWMEPGFGCRQARGPAGSTINLVGPARAPPWMDGRMEGCVDAASPFFCPPTRRQPGTRPKTTSPYQQQTWQLLHSHLLPLTRSLARSLAVVPSRARASRKLASTHAHDVEAPRPPPPPQSTPTPHTDILSPPPPWAPTCEQRAAPSASARAWAQKAMTKCTD